MSVNKDDGLTTPWWEKFGHERSAEDAGFSYSTVQSVKCETVFDEENKPVQKCQKVTRKFRQAIGRIPEEIETVTEDVQGGSPHTFCFPSFPGQSPSSDLERIFTDQGAPQRQDQRVPRGKETALGAPPIDEFISEITDAFRMIDSMARAMEHQQEKFHREGHIHREDRAAPGGLMDFFAPLLIDRKGKPKSESESVKADTRSTAKYGEYSKDFHEV